MAWRCGVVSARACAGLGRATGSGAAERDRRRSTVARDTPSAAQTAAVMPLTGGIVATASVKLRRRPASSGSPAGPQVFLDGNDRLGAGEAARQMGVVLFQQYDFCRQRIGFDGFRAAPGRRQRAEGAGVALAAPVAEGGRVNTFAAQNGANAAGFEGTIGCR